jgi:hypothetical protein
VTTGDDHHRRHGLDAASFQRECPSGCPPLGRGRICSFWLRDAGEGRVARARMSECSRGHDGQGVDPRRRGPRSRPSRRLAAGDAVEVEEPARPPRTRAFLIRGWELSVSPRTRRCVAASGCLRLRPWQRPMSDGVGGRMLLGIRLSKTEDQLSNRGRHRIVVTMIVTLVIRLPLHRQDLPPIPRHASRRPAPPFKPGPGRTPPSPAGRAPPR